MEVSGIIKVINPEQRVSDSFRKRELVVTTQEQYPQYISINFVQDKCDLLNNFQVGEEVRVSINLRGREWRSPQGEIKYFNDIQGWRIERGAQMAQQAPPAYQQAAPSGYQQPQQPAANQFAAPTGPFPPADSYNTDADSDDLPF